MSKDESAVVERLEALVERAGEELRRLRKANSELEAEVEKLSAAADEGEASRAQRRELVERLEGLVAGFEKALK